MTYATTTHIERKGFLDRLTSLKANVLTAINQRRVYERTVFELNALSDRDLTDLGISRLGIAEIAREAAYGK